jgi:hypothetical protein
MTGRTRARLPLVTPIVVTFAFGLINSLTFLSGAMK